MTDLCVCCLSDDEDTLINISTIDKITKKSYRDSLLEFARVKFENETFVICFECRNILRKTVSFIEMCRNNQHDRVVLEASKSIVEAELVIVEKTLSEKNEINQSNIGEILSEITLDEAGDEDSTAPENNERLIIEENEAKSQNTRSKSKRKKIQEETSPAAVQNELISEHDNDSSAVVPDDTVSEDSPEKETTLKKLKKEATDRDKNKTKKSFLCGDCGKTFPTAQRLNIHNLTHSGLKEFKCVEKLANGEICGKEFATEVRLKTHFRTHSGAKPYFCKYPNCNARFAQGNALTNHKRTHSKEKPYKCSYCDKRFSQNTILKTHLAIHLGKNVTCTWPGCEKKFARKSFMIVHIREHTKEKPYKCTFENCTNSYMQKSHLTRHQDTHNGVKYKCDVCDKEYSKAWSLKQHKYSHDESLPYKCPEADCSMQFSRRDKLNKHIEKLHKSSRSEALNAEIVLNEQPVIVETKDIQTVDASRIEYMANGNRFILFPENSKKIVITSGSNTDSDQPIYTVSEV